MPPASLIEYTRTIRRHTLERNVKLNHDVPSSESGTRNSLARSVAVGMKPKKIHEVGNFVEYIDKLTSMIDSSSEHEISHVVDFGSGQNYLGRALASPPYCKNVVAIESKHHNINGAKTMDVISKLVKKEKVMRNKKLFRMGLEDETNSSSSAWIDGPSELLSESEMAEHKVQQQHKKCGNIQYIESNIINGDLSVIFPQIKQCPVQSPDTEDPQLLVISLHSCGNLLHHGLRSLILNPSVRAVAMVGCCYNIMTERLGPPTYKYPSLRCPNLRLEKTSSASDPNGFPMSERLTTYKHMHGEGIRLNISARMMAVQAPQNWTLEDSEAVFTKHFYRALLQKTLVDRGVFGRPSKDIHAGSSSPRGWTGAGQPIILGSLPKPCYTSFTAYVRGAVDKLQSDPVQGPHIANCLDGLTDEDIERYEAKYKHKRKELSIVWSLMAFSAGVVESIILIDRWLYLKEQKTLKEAWVEAIFDYEQSPRNLVVVGIKDEKQHLKTKISSQTMV